MVKERVTPPEPRISAAPSLLDPVLGLVERLDRARRRIRPIHPGGLLGVERASQAGTPRSLRDGTDVRAGARIGVIHLDNRRLRELAGRGWPGRAYAVAREDLRALAARVAVIPAADRPIAFHGVTLLAPLVRRVGFEVIPRPRTRWVRLQDWYLRSLLARWSPDGRGRLARGHSALRSAEVWISTGALLRRYGPPPE